MGRTAPVRRLALLGILLAGCRAAPSQDNAGGPLLLVEGRSGHVLEVDAPPVPSPDGARFITTSLDLLAGQRPNRIRIYARAADGFAIEWEITPRDWGGTAPLWLDPGAIRLDRAVIDWSTTPPSLRTSPMRLERDGGEWRISPW